LIRKDYRVVTPAYGRDYRSAKEAKADFLAGRDFVLQPEETFVSRADFAPGVIVNIRYRRITMVTNVRVPA
jgi:hypothetical protein